MPRIASLPPRKNTMEIPDNLVNEIWDLLGKVKKGQAVTVNDEPASTQGKAMGPARKIAEKLEARYPGLKLRVHIIPEGDAFYAALSVKTPPTKTENGNPTNPSRSKDK